jgi:hypothetical protein
MRDVWRLVEPQEVPPADRGHQQQHGGRKKSGVSSLAMASSAAISRLSVLAGQLDGTAPSLGRVETRGDESTARPPPAGGRGTLTVLDNRTGKKYTVRPV